MEKIIEQFRSKEQELTLEKEPKLEKVVLLVRHPSVKWLDTVLEKAQQEKKDIETYTPVDVKGLKMTRYLSEYLRDKYLKKYLPQTIGEKNIDKKYTFWTSPIKRAETEARIISKNIKLFALEDKEIPLPKNNQPIETEYFGEIPWIDKKEKAQALIDEAKQKNVHPVKLWFEKNPEEIIDKLNRKLPEVIKGLEVLENSNTLIDIVFTHRLTTALLLWYIEERNKGREDFTITKKDLPRIQELTGKPAYTSISEIRKVKDKNGERWIIKSIGETPHLEKKPELKQGVY